VYLGYPVRSADDRLSVDLEKHSGAVRDSCNLAGNPGESLSISGGQGFCTDFFMVDRTQPLDRVNDRFQALGIENIDGDSQRLEPVDHGLRVTVSDRQAELRLQADNFLDVQCDITAHLGQFCRSFGKRGEPGRTDQYLTTSDLVTDLSEVGRQGHDARQGLRYRHLAAQLVNEDPAVHRRCRQPKYSHEKKQVFHVKSLEPEVDARHKIDFRRRVEVLLAVIDTILLIFLIKDILHRDVH